MAVLQSFMLRTESPGYRSCVDLVLGIIATMQLEEVAAAATGGAIVTVTAVTIEVTNHTMEGHNIILKLIITSVNELQLKCNTTSTIKVSSYVNVTWKHHKCSLASIRVLQKNRCVRVAFEPLDQ